MGSSAARRPGISQCLKNGHVAASAETVYWQTSGSRTCHTAISSSREDIFI